MSRNKSVFLGLLMAVVWMLFPALIASMGYATFILPRTVERLKNEGVKELPITDQFLADLSDFCKSHGVIIFPLMLILCIWISVLFLRRYEKGAPEPDSVEGRPHNTSVIVLGGFEDGLGDVDRGAETQCNRYRVAGPGIYIHRLAVVRDRDLGVESILPEIVYRDALDRGV